MKRIVGFWPVVLMGCPGPTPDAVDTSPEVQAEVGDGEVVDANPLSGKSIYTVELVTKEGQKYAITDRDLSGSPTAYSFGSTHIAPAVSLAVNDTVTYPAYLTVTFNFGIVAPSKEYPADCIKPGEYAFGVDNPPEVQVSVQGLQYSSRIPGAAGTIEVELWTATSGEPMRGSFKGTALQVETPEGQTPRPLEIEGEFYFTLPEKNQGG
jgi:hypothetical protein